MIILASRPRPAVMFLSKAKTRLVKKGSMPKAEPKVETSDKAKTLQFDVSLFESGVFKAMYF